MDRPLCVWFSRHAISEAQRAALAEYEVVTVSARPDYPDEAHYLIMLAAQQAGWEKPDLVVGVFPMRWLPKLLALFGEVPLVRLVMHYERGNQATSWTGQWQRLRSVQIKTESWQPER